MTAPTDLSARARQILAELGAGDVFTPDGELVATSPVDGAELGRLRAHTADDVTAAIGSAHAAFEQWRSVPAPVRGHLVRELGELLRQHKELLGELVSIEAGKIRSEGLGEVQEMIDICEFAVGLSRQLHGLTIASERPGHRMMEQWHPLGVVGVISAFNFPVAVWSPGTPPCALVAGDAVVWKPSDEDLADRARRARPWLLRRAVKDVGAPAGSYSPGAVVGGSAVGEVLVDDPRVAAGLGHRLHPDGQAGRTAHHRPAAGPLRCSSSAATTPPSSAPSADLDLAVRGIVFAAVRHGRRSGAPRCAG